MILSSYSGETEDTVAALRFARERGATTVGIVKGGDSAIARGRPRHRVRVGGDLRGAHRRADPGRCRDERGPARSRARKLATACVAVPAPCRGARGRRRRAEERAREFLSSRHLYVLGAGPLAPLAYKVALTVVMENIRIGGTWCDASEWRHGPAEALERSQADALMLIGTDARSMCERSLAFLREHGARTLVIDAADYAESIRC